MELEEDFSALKKDGLNVVVINREPAGLLEGTHLYKLGDTYYMMLIWWPKGYPHPTLLPLQADRRPL